MRTALLALSLITAAAATAFVALPAVAASQGTARATGNLPIRSGPGAGYSTIGTLPDGASVHLQSCTRNSNWCLILGPDGGQAGWVRGSYLVGSGAKVEVTPYQFESFGFGRRDH